MDDNYILHKLNRLMEEHGWTYYRLSQESHLPITSVRDIVNNIYQPSFSTLNQICDAFHITLSQFFSEDDKYLDLTAEQENLLNMYNLLNSHERKLVDTYIKALIDAKRVNNPPKIDV